MTRPRVELPPRGLNRLQAAAHIGVGTTTFDRMVQDGMMPPARAVYTLRVWDIVELDQAFDLLPHASGQPSPRAQSEAPLAATDFV